LVLQTKVTLTNIFAPVCTFPGSYMLHQMHFILLMRD